MENEAMMMQQQAEAGRATDTVLGHLSLGEVVIPRALLDDPQVMQILQQIFEANGANLAEFTVGDPANKINPETGHPEFFFKKLKSIFKAVAPLALSYFAPGLGTALGGALGAGAAFAPIVGGAALGAGTSALTGGNAIQGAALGGLGGGIQSAGAGNFNNTAIGRGISSITTGAGDLARSAGLGDILGSSGPVQGPLQPGAAGLGSNGTGISGAIARIGNALPGASSTQGAVQGAGVGASPSAYGGSSLGNILGGVVSAGAQSKAADQQLDAARAQMASFAPFVNQTFDEEDFKTDPGYDFRLKQGQQALERSQAARGGLFSGQAMRETQELGQGLADQTYNDSFNRYLQQQQQGLTAAGQVAGVQGNVGNIRSANTLGLNNTFANTLSQALGGGQVGANNASRTFVGYDAQGNPIYR